jgi:long-chain acyl-CoA synthetase
MNTDTAAINAVDRIAAVARATPDHPAIIAGDLRWTYSELIARVDSVAASLAPHIAVDDSSVPRMGLACPDGVGYIVLSLALLRLGVCVAPIASELAEAERAHLVQSLGLAKLVVGPGFDWADAPGDASTIACELDGSEPASVVVRSHVSAAQAVVDEAAFAALGPAFIRFSSGTTGASKGVVLSHRSLLDRVGTANAALGIAPADRVIWILPMAHHFAVSMMLYLTHGATTVVVGSHFAADVLDAAIAHGGTVLYGSPFHHMMLAGDDSGRAWPTLRLSVSTAAALTPPVAEAFTRRFGIAPTQALGIIEVGLPAINLRHAADKPTSIGRAVPGMAIELRDDDGQIVAPGEVGQLHLRGPGMFDAYFQPWSLRDEQLTSDGWFATGDLARADADGDLYLVGRLKSVINVAGLKCFPEEVEAVLIEHPQVKAVRVFGIAHPQVGSAVAAEVVPTDASDPPKARTLIAWCKDRLAAYKRPMQISFVEALRLTASGKIKRS